MKKSQLVQIIKEALTDKVKAVSIPVSKLQKGDTMAADKAKVTSIKKDGDNFEITLSGGKKLNYEKDKQVQIIRAGSTLKENTSVIGEEKSVDQIMNDLGIAIGNDDTQAMKAAGKALLSKLKGKVSQGAEKAKDFLEKRYNEESINEAEYTPERKVYDIVESSVERALSAIEEYKGSAESDQSGAMGLFHDVEIALEDVLDFLIYTQNSSQDK